MTGSLFERQTAKLFRQLGYRLQTSEAAQAIETQLEQLERSLAGLAERSAAELEALREAKATELAAIRTEAEASQARANADLEAAAAEKARLDHLLEQKLAKIGILIKARDAWKANFENERSKSRSQLARLADELGAERAELREQTRILARTQGALEAAEIKITTLIERRDELKENHRGRIADAQAERERLIGERNAAEAARAAAESAAAETERKLRSALEESHKLETTLATELARAADQRVADAQKAQARLQQAAENLRAVQAELAAERARLEVERSERLAGEKGHETEIKALRAKISGLIERRDELKATTTELHSELTRSAELRAKSEGRLGEERAAREKLLQSFQDLLTDYRSLMTAGETGGQSNSVVAFADERRRRLAHAMREAGDLDGSLAVWGEMISGDRSNPGLAQDAGQLLHETLVHADPPKADDVTGWTSFLVEPRLNTIVAGPVSTAEAPPVQASDNVLDELALLCGFLDAEAPGTGEAFQAASWRAGSALVEGEPPADLDRLLQAAILDDRNVSLWLAIAAAAITQDRFGLAAAASQKAVLLDPENLDAHAIRMTVLLRQGRAGLAAGHLMLAIERGQTDLRRLGAIVADFVRLSEELWPDREADVGAIAGALARRGLRTEALKALVVGAWASGATRLRRTLLTFCAETSERAAAPRARRSECPLVLISQIQRSGGTLITQLLDGHPELSVHPYELKIGQPRKWDWPRLDLSRRPIDLLTQLFEKQIPTFMVEGYRKSDGNSLAEGEIKPFHFDVDVFCNVFLSQVKRPKTQREVLDAYLAAYFTAWGGATNAGRSRWSVGFTPRVIMHEDSIGRFFGDYPDGRVISCIRDPVSWYASSRRHSEEYHSVAAAAELWAGSVRSAMALARARPDQVHLLTYESLVKDPQAVMRRLADQLGIAFDPVLLTPTFQGEPVLPNSSFDIGEYGVHTRSLDRSDTLEPAELDVLRANAEPLHREFLQFIGEAPPAATPRRRRTQRAV